MFLNKDSIETKAKSAKVFTWEEIRKHCTPNDAWIVIHNRVYDVSLWKDHPGGSVIFSMAGMDATDIFSVFHASATFKQLSPFCIGSLQEESRKMKADMESVDYDNFVKAYRKLRMQIKELGLDKASAMYYIGKTFSTLSIAAATFVLCYNSTSIFVHYLAACLLGVFYQQCGWLAHDFLHHQVFPERRYLGDYAGIFIGNVCQGFSVHWWKMKHNTHHAIPNIHGESESVEGKSTGMGDPDIDTMPFLAWSIEMARKADNSTAVGRFMIRHQALLYFPILLFARISWIIQSFAVAFDMPMAAYAKPLKKGSFDSIKYPLLEQMGMVLHVVWNVALFVIVSQRTHFIFAIIFELVSQMSAGVFLALAFGLGHNGREVYTEDFLRESQMDFGRLQINTTRNVQSSPLIDWFMGGLQYQTEHHLFPTVPRHHLGTVHDLMSSIAKEFRTPIHETSFLQGTREVLCCLSEISEEFITEFPAL